MNPKSTFGGETTQNKDHLPNLTAAHVTDILTPLSSDKPT